MKITVSWDPPSSPGHTTGYRIYYTTINTGQCTSVDPVMDISDITTITITGLTGGCYYTVFVAGLSEHLPSEAENATIFLGNIHRVTLYSSVVCIIIGLLGVFQHHIYIRPVFTFHVLTSRWRYRALQNLILSVILSHYFTHTDEEAKFTNQFCIKIEIQSALRYNVTPFTSCAVLMLFIIQ